MSSEEDYCLLSNSARLHINDYARLLRLMLFLQPLFLSLQAHFQASKHETDLSYAQIRLCHRFGQSNE